MLTCGWRIVSSSVFCLLSRCWFSRSFSGSDAVRGGKPRQFALYVKFVAALVAVCTPFICRSVMLRPTMHKGTFL